MGLPEGPSNLHRRDSRPSPTAAGQGRLQCSWLYSLGLGCGAGDGAELPPGLRGGLAVPWGLGASTWGDGNHGPLAPAVFGHSGNFVVGISPPFWARGILVAGEERETERGHQHTGGAGAPTAAASAARWGTIIPKIHPENPIYSLSTSLALEWPLLHLILNTKTQGVLIMSEIFTENILMREFS